MGTRNERAVQRIALLGYAWPDRVSVETVLGRNWTTQERTLWQRLLHKSFSRQALLAGYAIFGRQLQLDELMHLDRHPTQWGDFIGNSAGLAPLLGPHVRLGAAPPREITALRCDMLQRGLTPAAWRWLRRQHRDVPRKLFALGCTPAAVWWANLLCLATPGTISPAWLEAGGAYQGAMLYETWGRSNPAAQRQRHLEFQRFYALLPTEASAEALTQYEMLVAGIVLGLRNEHFRLSLANGVTWRSLLTQLRRRNDERAAQARALAADKNAAAQDPIHHWSALLRVPEGLGLDVEELCSDSALLEEGIGMAHCVGDGAYTKDCVAGKHAIVSLREPHTGMRATLQLRRGNQGWLVTQLAGPGNARVPQVFWRTARQLAAQA